MSVLDQDLKLSLQPIGGPTIKHENLPNLLLLFVISLTE